jgi:hypothetical protein
MSKDLPIREMVTLKAGEMTYETYLTGNGQRYIMIAEPLGDWEDRRVALTPDEARALYDWLGDALRITGPKSGLVQP